MNRKETLKTFVPIPSKNSASGGEGAPLLREKYIWMEDEETVVQE